MIPNQPKAKPSTPPTLARSRTYTSHPSPYTPPYKCMYIWWTSFHCTTWWWPNFVAETCSCALRTVNSIPSDIYIVVFDDLCIHITVWVVGTERLERELDWTLWAWVGLNVARVSWTERCESELDWTLRAWVGLNVVRIVFRSDMRVLMLVSQHNDCFAIQLTTEQLAEQFLWPVQHFSSTYLVILLHNAAELCTSCWGYQCSLARMNNVVLLRHLVQGCTACCSVIRERCVRLSLRYLYKSVVLEFIAKKYWCAECKTSLRETGFTFRL
jgi:hypothetical protein